MTRFWQVDFHPMEGHTSEILRNPLWARRFTPVQRLAKCGTVVTRAYSRALREGEPLEAKTSWGRFIFDEKAPPFEPVGVAMTASLGQGEVHEVPPPPLELLEAPDPERRLALLDFLHEHLLILGRSLHWRLDPLVAARESVIAGGIRDVLIGKPKASPDRRHRAVVTRDIDGDGDAWLRLEVHDKAGRTIRTSPPLPTHASQRTFNAVIRSLGWRDSDTVQVDHWPPVTPFEWPDDHLHVVHLR